MSSPWAYLGQGELMRIARAYGLAIEYRPLRLRELFDMTGGLPLARRHPARQRYRLMELQRWRDRRNLPLNLTPKHSPFDATMADRAVIVLAAAGGDPSGFIKHAQTAIWAGDRDLALASELEMCLRAAGEDAAAVLSRCQ
jgi:2-hydroxychromene-2-carboxylate isomerase